MLNRVDRDIELSDSDTLFTKGEFIVLFEILHKGNRKSLSTSLKKNFDENKFMDQVVKSPSLLRVAIFSDFGIKKLYPMLTP